MHGCRLRRVTEVLGRDVQWLLGNSRRAVEQLVVAQRQGGDAAQQLKVLAASVVAVLRHMPEEAARWPDALAVWSELMNKSALAAGFVKWPDVLVMLDEVLRRSPTGDDALLLAMLAMCEHAGAASCSSSCCGDIRVYRPPADPVVTHAAAIGYTPNYLVWTSQGAMDLHLLGKTTERLCPQLTAIVAGSIKARPREWLFERTDKKPYSAKEYSQMAHGRLKRLFGRPLTLQLLRVSKTGSEDHPPPPHTGQAADTDAAASHTADTAAAAVAAASHTKAAAAAGRPARTSRGQAASSGSFSLRKGKGVCDVRLA